MIFLAGFVLKSVGRHEVMNLNSEILFTEDNEDNEVGIDCGRKELQ